MTVTTSWDLFDDLRTAQDELLLRLTARRNGRPAQRDGTSDAVAWAPAVDICERRDAYLITAEIPGVSAWRWHSPRRRHSPSGLAPTDSPVVSARRLAETTGGVSTPSAQ